MVFLYKPNQSADYAVNPGIITSKQDNKLHVAATNLKPCC